MDIKINHDYHIHSHLSLCSGNPNQNKDAILKYAKDNGLNEICLTDHFWDSKVDIKDEFKHCGGYEFYYPQDYKHITESLPLPQDENVKFFFGCEIEISADGTLGITKETMDKLDFIIIPTTHLHMLGFTITEEDAKSLEKRAELWVSRFRDVLNMDLPFEKIGFAHLTCRLLAPNDWKDHIAVLNMISDEDLKDLFSKTARLGAGVEINLNEPSRYENEKDLDDVMRIYKIAKEQGCKFYFGSDAHTPGEFEKVTEKFKFYADRIGITEEMRYRIPRP